MLGSREFGAGEPVSSSTGSSQASLTFENQSLSRGGTKSSKGSGLGLRFVVGSQHLALRAIRRARGSVARPNTYLLPLPLPLSLVLSSASHVLAFIFLRLWVWVAGVVGHQTPEWAEGCRG